MTSTSTDIWPDSDCGVCLAAYDREKLLSADRRKDEFLAMLSHELRNPLAAIRGSAWILGHSPPGGQAASQAQAIIERQIAQLGRLVDDLLDVTRINRTR